MAVTITQEDVKKARSYMPLAVKDAVSRLMANLCVREVKNEASTKDFPLPDFCIEDRQMRQQCLYGVLAGWYLQKDFEHVLLAVETEDGTTEEKPINFCMTPQAVDEWAGSHVDNQIERLKRDKQIANKVYDLMYDYKGFESMLLGAIRERIAMTNDPALRLAQMLSVQTTPESVRELMKTMDDYRKRAEGEEDA